MSTVGSISNTSKERLQMLLMQQALSASGGGTTKSTQQSSSGSGVDASTGNPKGMAALQKKIEEAIATALASLDKSSSGQEVMSAIKSAIDQTLQANGITPPSGQTPSGPPPEGTAPPGPPPSNGSGGDLGSTIDRLLKEAGFDPDKIKSELQQGRSSSVSGSTGPAMVTMLVQIPLSGGVDTQV